MMKNTIQIIALVLIFGTISCSKDNDITPLVKPSEKKLTSITTSLKGVLAGTTTFNYNAQGQWISGVNYYNENYSITYNSKGKISSLNVENGLYSSDVEYLYSKTSDVSLNTIKVDNYETNFIYNNSKITELEFYNGNLEKKLLITYDANGRIKTITHDDTRVRYSYTYDAANRITRVDELNAGTSSEPYILVSYAEYEYESHKNPVYKLFKQQMDFDQLIFSPISTHSYFSSIFSYTDYNNIYILSEYNIKSIKLYDASNTSQSTFDVTMNYVLENDMVMSFTTTTSRGGTAGSELITYTYEK